MYRTIRQTLRVLAFGLPLVIVAGALVGLSISMLTLEVLNKIDASKLTK